jgi:uncharacterized membrane protein YhaH (DUF805 family)
MSSYCSQCGTGLSAGTGFCPSCGKAVPRPNAFGPIPTPPPAAPQPAYQPQDSYTQPSYAASSYGGQSQQLSGWEWMILPLKRYADFSGRSQRQEYWMFYLLNAIVLTLTIIVALLGVPWTELQTNPDAQPNALAFIGIGLLILWILGTLVPNIAVAVRRFHDQNQSGWMYCLSFIPYVGGLILIVFMCFDGTPGSNRYGPDPKGRGAGDVFA